MGVTEKLVEYADELRAMAGQIAGHPPGTDPKRNVELAETVESWTVVLRRLPDVVRTAYTAINKVFDAPGTFDEDDRRARLAVHVDLIAFLAIGDMVLDDFARAELHRRGLPAGEVPWASLMLAIDAGGLDDPIHYPARTLDLTLREGRNRLLAHRRGNHWSLPTYGEDGAVGWSRVRATESARAVRMLEEVAATLPAPLPDDRSYDLLKARVREAAGLFGYMEREHARRAFREGGFSLPPLHWIVGDVVTLIRHYLRAASF